MQAPRVQLRAAGVGDAVAIASVQCDAWRAGYAGIMPSQVLEVMSVDDCANRWRAALAKPGRGCYKVAVCDGQIVAFATYGPARDHGFEGAELVALNVLPEFWRQGLGRELLVRIIAELKTAYSSLYLWVARDNIGARRFYETQGFTVSGQEKQHPEHGNIVETCYRLCLQSPS
ncbi:GNAT family N-acetyltransferase [Gilvimarinus sp. SDUM040013]|uniref:GNAT family N-acetyltransferase n=1 Tax=Gilvimarinus gilvus TaxID=3058038 RepID=A0ABU4RSK8_9GAMM|nr:GNAT family N-acetyltransferase [Gilvimarinus sp. SDUM040013]MDO3388339.1 GNAT family N-acetyltransferase [Gilvimarinus sp. SDUM040013]MDX6847889.1 GNAT family N-acetyltransferase [Gilvimarinus sp. SDUM040013]